MIKFPSCILKCALNFSLMLFNITYFTSSVNLSALSTAAEPDSSLMIDLEKEALEAFLLKALDQLKLVDATIEDLATVVSNDIITKIKDKSDHVTKLRCTREMITSLTNKSYVCLEAGSIYALVHVTRSIANFLLDHLDDGFYKIEYFDPYYIQIPQKESLTIEDLQRDLIDNDELLAELDNKAANIGLCWYNKLYRTTKKKITLPWRRYHLGPILTVGSAASVVTLLLWWQFDIKFPKSLRDFKVPFTDKRILGPTPRVDSSGEITSFYDNDKTLSKNFSDDNERKEYDECLKRIGLMGSLERMTTGLFFSHQTPITSKLSSLLFTGVGSRYLPGIFKWFSHKAKLADNFMMGGAYKHRPAGDVQYISKVNFDNVIGCNQAKKIGRELCMYLKDPERFDRSKLTPAKGYLFIGKTRTGKSYFIESLLGELQRTVGSEYGKFKILPVSYSLIEENGIEVMLSYAKSIAPCILFIDEIDLLGLQRTEDRKRLSEFLTAMSGYLSEIDPDKAVIIVGATNKQESIDFALKQPGRFGVIIPFEQPTFVDRKEFIKRELTKLAVSIDLFDIEKLARESEGYVFEAISLVIKKAMIRAKVNNEPISQLILEDSFDETIRGILEDSKLIPEGQKEMLAAHMAGHALANLLLKPNLCVNKVTIQKVRSNVEEQALHVQAWIKEENKQKPTEYGKIFYNHENDSLEFETKEELIKQCKVTLAGHAAERIILGECSYSYHAHDRKIALETAQSIIIGGLDLAQLPKKIKDDYLRESYNLMKTCEQEIEQLLLENKEELVKLAQMLKEKGTLGIREINSLFDDQKENAAKKADTSDDALSEIISKQTKK